MRAALIPPKGLYATTSQTDYHLLLAHITDVEYWKSYQDLPATDFKILDNGAAEGSLVDDESLLDLAISAKVNEIVVPDVIGDSMETVDRARKFFDFYRRWKARYNVEKDFHFMGVLQSEGGIGGIHTCISHYRKMDLITTLGIPRHLTGRDKYFRYQVAASIKGQGLDNRYKVHLLGTHPKVPEETCFMAEQFPWIRGIDSSLPYNYALAGELLTTMHHAEPIGRPERYFVLDSSEAVDTDLLVTNINTFIRWASGSQGTGR